MHRRRILIQFSKGVTWLTLIVALIGFHVARPTQAARSQPVLNISAIPDQDVAVLNRQFGQMAAYLSQQLGIQVRYVPFVDYSALIHAFQRGDIHLAWFGGLTAVQAMAAAPGTEVIAQRPRDEAFHSVFIVNAKVADRVKSLTDLKGLSFSFGSESSTSGHLMPRYFLMQAGINPEADFLGLPNYSGSHDKTIRLVESGAYQAGAVNEAVWQTRLQDGQIDTAKVRAFYTSPAYYDYNWAVGPGIDAKFGAGTKQKIQAAILRMGEAEKHILDLFATDKFIPSKNENYKAIQEVAKKIGIIR